MNLVLLPAAEQDIADAMAWYDSQSQGLGDVVLSEVEACFARILPRPARYPVAYGPFRRALVRRFPYVVYFRVDADELLVFAIYHQRRDPATLRTRLSSQ